MVELFGLHDAAFGADGEIELALAEVAAGQFQVLAPDGVEKIVDGEVVGAELFRIGEDVDLALGTAHNSDLTDTGGAFQLLLQQLVGDHGDVAERALCAQANLEHGRGVGIELQNFRALGGSGQIVDDLVDLVLDFLSCDVAILREQEGDLDERASFGRDGAELVDFADGVDGFLDLLGDLGLDFLGRSPGIGYHDLDRGDIDFRKQVDAEGVVGERSDHDQGHDQHGGENRALDAEFG